MTKESRDPNYNKLDTEGACDTSNQEGKSGGMETVAREVNTGDRNCHNSLSLK